MINDKIQATFPRICENESHPWDSNLKDTTIVIIPFLIESDKLFIGLG